MAEQPIKLHILSPATLATWQASAPAAQAAWADAHGFAARMGQSVALPSADGAVEAVLLGWGNGDRRARGRFHLASYASRLPAGRYVLATCPDGFDEETELLGWALAQYRFDTYREQSRPEAVLVDLKTADRANLIAQGALLTQRLIDTPASDMGPVQLEAAVRDLAAQHGASVAVTTGDALLDANFPMIHAVGRASVDAPRLIDLSWGAEEAAKVTLVGKGVCFDTGGLNLKPASSMGLMKKDMGGAANAIGLAYMIMALNLPVRLRLLIPAVENSVSAASFRPQDILTSRKGLSVEINNTDAEGRLVLADALALADEEAPDLLLCLATLTGAARVALGPDVPPFFSDDEELALCLAEASAKVADPIWRMPFWDPYESMIEPGVADLDNAPKGGMAGAITAALFLRRFVENAGSFAHFDLYGWTPHAKPARPKGGAHQGIRAMLAVIEERYS